MEPRPIPLGIIINRVKNKPYEVNPTEIREFTGLPVIGVIPEDENVLKSVNRKTLVTILKESSSASQAFFETAAKLVGVTYRKPSLWARIVSMFKG
jgi:MinD-like ATPase involved in chromosome partitioning or flagellar assembly